MAAALVKSAIRIPMFQFYRLQMKRKRDRMRFLFIMSHMRSGSTLLLHILASHPEITGFGEMHQGYKSEEDLMRLACFVKYTKRELFINERYVMDKLVQKWDVVAETFLRDPRIYFIFLTRHGREALPSMVKMYRKGRAASYDESWYAEYMAERCNMLVNDAERIPDFNRKFYLSNTELVHRTGAALQALGDFLNLQTPLNEDYSLMNTTGTAGVGDPSPYIRTGKIVRNRKSEPIGLPEEMIQVSQAATDECEQRLRELCQTVDGP